MSWHVYHKNPPFCHFVTAQVPNFASKLIGDPVLSASNVFSCWCKWNRVQLKVPHMPPPGSTADLVHSIMNLSYCLLLSPGYNTSLKNSRGEINISNLVQVLDMMVAILFIHWAQKLFCAHKQLTQVSCQTIFFRKLPIAHLFIHSSLFADPFLIHSFTPSFLPSFLPSFGHSLSFSSIHFVSYSLTMKQSNSFTDCFKSKIVSEKNGLLMFCFISYQNVPIVCCKTLEVQVVCPFTLMHEPPLFRLSSHELAPSLFRVLDMKDSTQ